ncbi:MAG: c-type cytochrome [Planctomycetota bacterium]
MHALRITSVLSLLFGSLCVTGCGDSSSPVEQTTPSLPAEFAAGKEIYDTGCGSCHDSSREGSPRLGYLAAWKRRLAQGEEVLIQHAIEGLDLMPPKGDNANLSDEEVALAVRYMIDRAEQDLPARH